MESIPIRSKAPDKGLYRLNSLSVKGDQLIKISYQTDNWRYFENTRGYKIRVFSSKDEHFNTLGVSKLGMTDALYVGDAKIDSIDTDSSVVYLTALKEF